MSGEKSPAVKPDSGEWIHRLNQAGFNALDQGGGRVLVSKNGCGSILERTSSGDLRFAVRPGLLVGDGLAHLVDRGFQKFWQLGDRRFPALASQLKALHKFANGLRAVMGLTSLYNESLGTVSSRYVYDRIEGRETPKTHQSFD